MLSQNDFDTSTVRGRARVHHDQQKTLILCSFHTLELIKNVNYKSFYDFLNCAAIRIF